MSLADDITALDKRIKALESAPAYTGGAGIKVDGKTISTDPDDAAVVKPITDAVAALKAELDKVATKVGA